MNLKALNRFLRKQVGPVNVPRRSKPVQVSENVRKQVLLYLVMRAEEDGTKIFPTKQTIANEMALSKRAVQLAINTLLLPTPFGGPPVLHKDGFVTTRKGRADRYRIDLDALWRLPDIKVDDDVLERTEFTSGVNVIHPTSEPNSSHPVNEIHPERPSEIPKKDLGKTAQGFSAKEEDLEGFLEAYPVKSEDPNRTHEEYVRAIERGATPSALVSAAWEQGQKVSRGLTEPVDPADWLSRDLWKRPVQPYRYHPGGIVRG